MMGIIKEEEDLYNNNILEKVYFENGDMVLRFQTVEDKDEFDKLLVGYIKLT